MHTHSHVSQSSNKLSKSAPILIHQQKILAIMQFIHNYHKQVSISTLLNGYSFYQLLLTLKQQLNSQGDNNQHSPSNKYIRKTHSKQMFNFQTTVSNNLHQNCGKSIQWNARLINYLEIISKIQQYVITRYSGTKKVNTIDIDLIALCKFQNEVQIIKIFELVMAILIQSQSKQKYIQSIMQLSQNSQQCFVSIIKNSLEDRLINCDTDSEFSQRSHIIDIDSRVKQQHQQIFMTEQVKSFASRLLKQFEMDIKYLEQQNHKLNLTTNQLQFQLSQTLDQFQHQQQLSMSNNINNSNCSSRVYPNLNKVSSMEASTEDLHLSQILHLQQQLNKVKNRLLDCERIHQTEKNSLSIQIEQLLAENTKYLQVEQLCTFYKQKYEDIMNEVRIISIWKKQKIKLQKLVQEKDFMLQKFNDNLVELQQKNTVLQQRELQMKLDMQTKDVIIEQMKYQVKKMKQKFGQKSVSGRGQRKGSCGRRYGARGLTLFGIQTQQQSSKQQHLTQSHHPRPTTQNSHLFQHQSLHTSNISNIQLDSLKKQLLQQRTKTTRLQAQLKKSTLKTQKLRTLQQTNKKLQYLVYDLTHNQNEQIQLLIGVVQQQYACMAKKRECYDGRSQQNNVYNDPGLVIRSNRKNRKVSILAEVENLKIGDDE